MDRNAKRVVGGGCTLRPQLCTIFFSDTTLQHRAVSVFRVNVDLRERVRHLTNKIYREMLYIVRRERMTYITMGGPNYIQASPYSTPQYRIILSWDLLAWMDSIPYSFTNFITTQELSGPFYISLDIYHTQITEYSLETIFLHNYSR